MQCAEGVTHRNLVPQTGYNIRQCLFSAKFYVRRRDGDTRRVCGIHKNQLVREGWRLVK